jgi:ABC-type microcin C transport system duplicated ATPase subunit YejF
VALIRHGRIVEQGPCRQIFDAPQTDYARTLLAAMPEVRVDGGGEWKTAASGAPA